MPAQSARADLARTALARSIYEISPLQRVVEAIAVATEDAPVLIYVERMARGWRWSLAHKGGPYALLRTTALFLRIAYHALVIGCRTVGQAAVLRRNPNRSSKPQG